MDAVVAERWREERRDRILHAAADVFGADGYSQVSMDAVARAAGIGKPTLYRYFPSKDALFGAVFVHALDRLEARLDRALASEATAREQLVALIAAIVPVLRDHLVSSRLLGGGSAALDQSRRRIFRERRTRIGSFLARALDGGMRRGELRRFDATRVAHLTIGTVWSASAADDGRPETVAREIADLLFDGLAAGPGVSGPEPATDARPSSDPSGFGMNPPSRPEVSA